MKKTISINVGNQNFIIEDDAYEQLLAYLENVKKHCGTGIDATEVIADIESSMAEKLKSSLSKYKETINTQDITSLIKIMGTIEDFDREVGNSQDEETAKEDQQTKRKLYRDTDNAIIGGVAAGLGNYFDIDPVLFRIIFCALVLAGGSGFLIYILLWIAMPEAKTAHQKLEMQGQAPTLAAFRHLAEKSGKQLKANWNKHSVTGKILRFPALIINHLFLAIKKVWQAVWPIIKLAFGLFLSLFSFVILGGVGIGSLFLLLYNNSSHQIAFIPISEITALMPYTLMVLSAFLSLAIPALLVLFGGLAIIRKKNLINFTTGSILVGVWMAAGITCCALGLRYFPEVRNKIENYPLTKATEQTIDLKGVKEIEASGDLINILVTSASNTPATVIGRKIDLDQIEIKHEGKKLLLIQKPLLLNNEICLDCRLLPIRLTVATSSTLKINATAGTSVFDETSITAEIASSTEEEMEIEE